MKNREEPGDRRRFSWRCRRGGRGRVPIRGHDPSGCLVRYRRAQRGAAAATHGSTRPNGGPARRVGPDENPTDGMEWPARTGLPSCSASSAEPAARPSWSLTPNSSRRDGWQGGRGCSISWEHPPAPTSAPSPASRTRIGPAAPRGHKAWAVLVVASPADPHPFFPEPDKHRLI